MKIIYCNIRKPKILGYNNIIIVYCTYNTVAAASQYGRNFCYFVSETSFIFHRCRPKPLKYSFLSNQCLQTERHTTIIRYNMFLLAVSKSLETCGCKSFSL